MRSWYSRSFPEMGYLTECRKFGLYSRNIKAVSSRTNRVTVRDISPGDIEDFLDEVSRWYGGLPVRIWVDDREIDELMGPAFVEAGCACRGAEVFLAHDGPVPARRAVGGLTMEPVTLENLAEFAVAKLKAFSNTEAEPSRDDLESEIAIRRAELEGVGRFMIGRHEGEPAGIIAWFDLGSGRFIAQLATRVRFRHSGVAGSLIGSVIRDAYQLGCRSVVISADPADTPVHFYRRLGFNDEVYWRHGYMFRPGEVDV